MARHQVQDRPKPQSSDVSAFYERHPYPPPRDDLSDRGGAWGNEARRAQSHLFWPGEPFRDDRRVLVAGCGTSQAARLASRWPNAEVVGIDISATSLDFSAQLKQRHGLANLELRRLAIEDARELASAFDHIICTGVLHHLPQPDLGLRALHDVLAPNGAMNLMLYAPYGRAGIYLLQDYCRRLGVTPASGDLRDLAATLSALPAGHPLIPLLRNAPDFQSEAGLADALLHPQDRAYSAPELFALLETCGMRFGRWLRQAAYLPQCGAPATTPHGSRLMQLPITERYAAMELFRGTMVRHTFIAHRADAAPQADPSAWLPGDWSDAIPIRLPDTVVVRDRLPPGAAAVLINRAHTSPDLYLQLDRRDLDIFNAIDGRRCVGQLCGGGAAGARTRPLLQRLWDYDHVVFDRSAA